MVKFERWVLPEGIEELLPEQAVRVEHLRRQVLDLFSSWGYQLVIPPLVEYMDALIVGAGNDLKRYTFKLVDERNGRLIGVRADMTPQVARIDAHRLQRSGSARLCYFGPVLLTQPRQLGGSRSPLQTGAELYGHPGRESDIEIMRLMLEVLHKTGVRNPFLDLGHVGIFRGLVEQAKLNKDLENRLFDALQRKARPEIEELVSEVNDNNVADMFKALIDLNGGEECLAECKKVLVKANKDVLHALDEVEKISASLKQYFPKLRINFDFAELRGYQYHTGVVFAVYSEGHWQALAQGGRYDDVGAAFGSSRPATGFSMDINTLLRVTESRPKTGKGVWAPAADDINLRQTISDLRAKGERVIEELPGIKDTPQELGCDRQLVSQGTQWVIEDLVK